jgi:DNA topoisomerase-1
MSKPLVIVESPTKAKTIGKFLGSSYEVLASYGHIRDLPNNASEIPASLKKEKWTRLGINIEQNFEPLYIIPDKKKDHVKQLKKSLENASELYLATDEDREGESISWHLLEVLKPKVPVKRLVFHEITKEAIKHALDTARTIDDNLVRAQETRRTIDRLFGYSVSPILWKKMAPGLSAGRVQSVAMRLLVERERERMRFIKASYWDLSGSFSKLPSSDSSNHFEAELTHLRGTKIAIGKDFQPETGKLDPSSSVLVLGEREASDLKAELASKDAVVASIEEKPFTTRPYAPFTTSTLQQEGSAKLGFAAKRTMQIAQMLYENGFITYMRTDSTTLSSEALTAARELITREYGDQFLHPEPRIYTTKVKNAQEAHEAIRPAGAEFVHPTIVKDKLGNEAFRLYELIWKRTVACQMKDAKGTRVTAVLTCGDATFRATGRTIDFPGYLRAYVEGSEDPDADLAERDKLLPKLAQGEKVAPLSFEAVSHETQPPARYTEGTLIKELEKLGIGRPSTWATIVDVVLSRDYAFKKGTALVPTFLASAVTNLMERYFTHLLDYEFTAHLEDDLDAISRGEADSLKYLTSFYYGNGHAGLSVLVKNGEEKIDPKEVCGLPLGLTPESGVPIEVRIGRFGPFISNGTDRASVPDGIAPDELSLDKALGILAEAAKGPQALGADPSSGLPVFIKKGRFGPYVQLGEQVEGGDKPKMASLLPGMVPDSVTLEQAAALLTFPKVLGKHPESNEEIIASNGRYGPYIKAGTDTRSIPTDEVSLLDITLEKAIEILARPKTRGRQNATPKALKEVGKHPVSELVITLRSGRYGPYVSDGKVNASLPRGANPDTLTIAEAVQLIDARAATVGDAPPKQKRKSSGTRSRKKSADA